MDMCRAALVVILVLSIGFPSCSPDLSDDQIPRDTFSPETLNLNLPSYAALFTDGGWIYYNDIGVRGIIIYRLNASSYLAFERTCSYQPNTACATVEVDVSSFFMKDPCCNSTFDFSGKPTGAPAWRALLQYRTELNGSELTITDEIVN